jgi:hypothetical protein
MAAIVVFSGLATLVAVLAGVIWLDKIPLDG